jgi:hypothetical protein
VRAAIASRITSAHPEIYALDNKKAVDIVVCRDLPKNPALFFIEVKFHKQNHGRLGFGSSNGGGFQPEIVRRRPTYFETNLRWVISSDECDGIVFATSDEIRGYVAGGVVGEKFNNIQSRIFRDAAKLTEDEFIDSLKAWLIPT